MSLSAGILSAGFCYTQKIENWIFYGLFSFFSTLAVYNGQRLFKAKEKKETEWLYWVINHKLMLIILVAMSILSSAILFFYLDQQVKIIYPLFALVGVISILYVVRIKGKNLREIPYIKSHLIAITWAIVLILFPLINEGINDFSIGYAFTFYLYVFAVTIPFDVRDFKYDKPSQKTLPQLIGVRNSKILSIILLLTVFIIVVAFEPQFLFNFYFVLSMLVQFVLLFRMNEKRGDFYCAGLIDGAIGLMGLSLFLL